jgi:hypothetical protein
MELETRCEAELEQAEDNFQNEQRIVTQNAKLRQVQYSIKFYILKKFFFRILYVILIINNILFYIK